MNHLRGLALALLALAILALSMPARAIDLDRCSEDGVTEVPIFAQGRDANGCLVIDPGNGDPAVHFQFEVFHRTGISKSAVENDESPSVDVLNIDHSDCSNGTEGCTVVVWDTTVDHYLDQATKNEDVLFIGAGHRIEYMLIKDSVLANSFTCKGGGALQGPNGLSCASGETSGAHVDGLQMRGNPINDGWFVMQNTTFVNGFNLHMLVQAGSQLGRLGSFVLQGVEFGRRQTIGAAEHWIDDCVTIHDSSGGGEDICPNGRAQIGNDMREVWFIDVFGTTVIDVKGNSEKLVVVNSGCHFDRCGLEAPGFNGGWPHPLPDTSESGPGTCPNGQISSFKGIPTFCYTSLEAARADHKLPPFAHLSDAGWSTPAPPAPEPDPTPEPEPEPEPTPEPAPQPEPAPTTTFRPGDECSVVVSRPVPCSELEEQF